RLPQCRLVVPIVDRIKKMKLLCSVIALATASLDCDGDLCRRKNACTNTPTLGQVLREQDDYVVTQDDVDNWQACGDNADCTSGRGWNFECACSAGYIDFAPESYRKHGACVYDSCMDTVCQDNSSCSVSADGAASCACDEDYYFESVEQFNEGGNSTGFADTCYFDACATDPCSANTDCANDAGSAVCSCSAGFFDYAGDASNCVPDACGSSDDCSADAACTVELPDVNGTAQWSCACDDGFYGNGVDCWVDSCASDPCQADAACTNDMNDFSCECNAGFYLGADVNGTDFCHGDVCANANPCDANAACANNADGSQTCTCNDGYKGEGYECTNIAGERAANILARADEFASTAAAELVNDTRALNRVNQALGKYTSTIAYVDAWEVGCMNNVDLQAAAEEAADLASDEELLGWEINDLCSFASDMQAAAKRFARSFACVEYFGYNPEKPMEFNTKRVHKQLKRNNNQLRAFGKKVAGALSCE
ncbi:unnamed protein product, partial [Oikopleura dioica]